MTSEPLLAMLWESVDPADTLTKRFGFADAVSAANWIGETLWDTWGIAVEECDRLVMSAENLLAWITTDGGPLIAKWSVTPERFNRLADTAALITWLHARGLPVAAPIPATDGRLQVELNRVSLGVHPVIDGDLLDVGGPAYITDAGHMLATLHQELAAYPHPIDGRRPTQHKQLVQNDFRSANILHDGTSIPAVLDFEDATYGTRVTDLAKATVLLGTRYHNWGPTSHLVREAFITAYQEQAPLTNVEQHQLQDGITTVLNEFGWQ